MELAISRQLSLGWEGPGRRPVFLGQAWPMADCPFLAICLELYSILLPTAKNIFAVKNVTLKARSGVSEEHRAELYRKGEGAVSQDGTSRFLQNGRWSDFMMNVLILP